MTTVRDEDISAWIDGELDEATAQRITQLARQNAAVADTARQFRRVDALVREAIPEEPVPPALLERLGLAASGRSNVIDLAAKHKRSREAAIGAPPTSAPRRWDQRRIAAMAALFIIGLAVTSFLVLRGPTAPASYRTLGSEPQAERANALVLFSSDVEASEAHSIIAAIGGSIVGDQTAAGAFKVAIDPDRRDGELELLRDRPDVRLAEPLDGEETP